MSDKLGLPSPQEALPGRSDEMPVAERHVVLPARMTPPFPPACELAMFGMGCFWGAERVFWETPGVYTTAVGYAGGHTPNPTYEETCSGRTGHAEAVLVAFDPNQVTFASLVKIFFEAHDPTQGMRQGNDRGTEYRSAIYFAGEEQRLAAESARDMYNETLCNASFNTITTEIAEAGPFYYAEDYHQQYLDKNPGGYCGMGGTGVSCSVVLSS